MKTPTLDGFLGGELLPGRVFSCRFTPAVIRVFTTQMGLVISTVNDPAMAPAVMDSIVVSFLDARPALRAASSKNDLDHSYPSFH